MKLPSPFPESAPVGDTAVPRTTCSAHARVKGAPRAVVAAVLVLLSIASARGDVLIDNLATDTSSGYAFQSTNRFASGFTLSPSATSYTLENVVFSLNATSSAPYLVYLQANSGGNPGALLATLSPDPQSGAGNYTFRPGAAFTLLAGTTYWLTLDNTATGEGVVRKVPADSPAMTLAPGVTYEGLNASGNEGGSWGGAANDGVSFQLNAAPVPEPAVTSLIFLGVSLLGYRKLRQRRD